MAFLKENKRKTVTSSFIDTDTIININLRDQSITDGHGTANFERLLYLLINQMLLMQTEENS